MCLQAPTISPPTLGGGFSISPPATPDFSGDLALCCKRLPFNIPTPPIPLPPLVVNGALSAIFTAAFATLQAYVDALSIDCPLE